MAWQLVESVTVHSTPWFDVRDDLVVRPDGVPDNYARVITPEAVTVLALDECDQVLMTRQWIYQHGGTEWRLPSGVVGRADHTPVAAAQRELIDEAGLHAANWSKIGVIHGADSVSDHVDNLFLATGLTVARAGSARTGSAFADRRSVCWVAFSDALDLVRDGQLPHAGSGHALLRVALDRSTRTADYMRH